MRSWIRVSPWLWNTLACHTIGLHHKHPHRQILRNTSPQQQTHIPTRKLGWAALHCWTAAAVSFISFYFKGCYFLVGSQAVKRQKCSIKQAMRPITIITLCTYCTKYRHVLMFATHGITISASHAASVCPSTLCVVVRADDCALGLFHYLVSI